MAGDEFKKILKSVRCDVLIAIAEKPPANKGGNQSRRGAVWLAHFTGGEGVAGSNPVVSTRPKLDALRDYIA